MYTYERNEGSFSEEYPYISEFGHLFHTEQAAAAFCAMWNEHWAAMARLKPLSTALSREEYEAAAEALGVPALPDADCDSYGVRYGEFEPWFIEDEDGTYRRGGYSPEDALTWSLARHRLRGIEAERAATPPPPDNQGPDYPHGRTLDCGCVVFYQAEVMHASRGTSCDRCYDRMSN